MRNVKRKKQSCDSFLCSLNVNKGKRIYKKSSSNLCNFCPIHTGRHLKFSLFVSTNQPGPTLSFAASLWVGGEQELPHRLQLVHHLSHLGVVEWDDHQRGDPGQTLETEDTRGLSYEDRALTDYSLLNTNISSEARRTMQFTLLHVPAISARVSPSHQSWHTCQCWSASEGTPPFFQGSSNTWYDLRERPRFNGLA